jgi:succinate-semialdehyde dehydrogenase/glutarate-semialdehyde dehydrogenase
VSNYPDLQLYIDGRWTSADGQPVINPADETTLGIVPHAGRRDLDAALEAAEKGLRVWRDTAPAERARIILKDAQLIRERVEEMAVAMTLEQGARAAPKVSNAIRW